MMELRRSTTVSSAPSSKSARPKTKASKYVPSDEDDDGISSVSKRQFDLLRPVTVQVMSNPTVQNLTQLVNIVANILPEKVEACILDYILFPLSHHLKNTRKLKDDVLIMLHDCVKVVLNKYQIPRFTFFAELYQFCMMSICKADDPGSYDKSMSEIVVERVVVSIHALIQRSLSKHFKKLYSEKYIAAVGHGICILLQIVNQDTAKSLRVQSIRTILLLIRICDGEVEACHRVFKFLPGLATTFVRCSIIHGGRFQTDVLKESLGALKVALITCISFEKAESLVPVDTNLSPGIVEISESLLFHEEKRLRTALADFTISVIEETKMKLPKCSETLWNNVLVLAANNEDKETCAKALSLLKNPINKSLTSALCNFKAIEHHLKKAVIQSNVGELGRCNLSAHGVAGALAVAKLSLTELRSLLPRIADLRTTTIRRQQEYEDKKPKVQDRRIVNACTRMVQFILESHDVLVVVAEFFVLLERGNNLEDVTSLRSSGTLLLMNAVLELFLSKRPANLNNELVETITEKYLTLLCPLPMVISERRNPLPSLANSSGSKKMDMVTASSSGICLHTCSILQAFPTFTKLEPQLLHMVTFPLLEYAGLREPDYALVAETAVESLTKIAKNSSLSLRDYLSVNLEVVMSEFSSRTHVICDYPHMADALVFLAEYFDFSQSRFLDFIEKIIMFSASQKFESKYHQIFTNIYYAYIFSMWKHYFESNQTAEGSTRANSLREKEPPSLAERLFAFQTALGIAQPIPDSEDEDGEGSVDDLGDKFRKVGLEGKSNQNNHEGDDEGEEGEKKAPMRPEISLTLKIAKKAAGYLSGETRDIKLTSMEILIKAIQILSPYQDELLPLLHQCWLTLVSRFEEKEYVVLRKSFELLLTMVNYSGDFLRKRTIEGIFPILSLFLEELAEQSKNIEEKNMVYYTFTQGFKLQHTILTGLGELCEAMEIGERDLDRVVNACLVYLGPSQHKKLKEAAIDLMFCLADGHCGSSIWMKLIAYGVLQVPPTPTNQEFKPLPPGFTDRSKEDMMRSKKKAVRRRAGK